MREGEVVYYIDGNCVYSGTVIEIEDTDKGYVFSIDSYGDCSGQYRISSSQINRTVFLSREEALKTVLSNQELMDKS